jgi:hypothetical protein
MAAAMPICGGFAATTMAKTIRGCFMEDMHSVNPTTRVSLKGPSVR